jgi:hypothetical protein
MSLSAPGSPRRAPTQGPSAPASPRRVPRQAPSTPPRYRTFVNRGFAAFPDARFLFRLVTLDVSDNPLTSFEGLSVLPFLRILHANGTQIASFKGAVILPALEILNLLDAPVAAHRYFPLMALLSLNLSLQVLNGRQIPEAHWKMALDPEVRARFLPWLREGFVVADVAKKIVMDPATGDQIRLDLDPKDAVEQQAVIDANERLIEALKQRRRVAEKERYAPPNSPGEG